MSADVSPAAPPASAPSLGILEVLAWLGEDTRRSPRVLDAAICLGAHDPLAVGEALAGDVVAEEEIAALTRARPGAWPPATRERMFATVGIVGAQVWLEAPGSVDAWTRVVSAASELAVGVHTAWDRESRRGLGGVDGPRIVAELRARGRGPEYALEIFAAAAAVGVAPNALGYAPGISAQTLGRLAGAGVRTPAALAAFTEAGCSPAEAADLAEAGVSGRLATFAAATGLARAEWVGTLGGLPDWWFYAGPGGVSSPMVEAGFSWEELRFLVGAGWSQMRGMDLVGRDRLRREDVLRAAAVATYPEVQLWRKALTAGKVGAAGVGGPAMPPLRAGRPSFAAVARDVSALVGAGLRPAHLSIYRSAGCRSVEDVLTALAAAVTPARARAVLAAAGEQTGPGRAARLGSVDALLAAHAATAS